MECLQPEKRDRRSHHARQQQADVLARLGAPDELGSENERAGDELVVIHGLALDVLEHDVSAAVNPARIEQRLEHGGAIVAALEHHVAHDVVEHVAGVVSAFPTLDLLGDLQLDRRHEANRHSREPPCPHLSPELGERRVLRALYAHRQHRRARLVGDHSRTLVHFHERAGHGDAALGEDHHPTIVLAVRHQRADGEGIRWIDGEGLRQ